MAVICFVLENDINTDTISVNEVTRYVNEITILVNGVTFSTVTAVTVTALTK